MVSSTSFLQTTGPICVPFSEKTLQALIKQQRLKVDEFKKKTNYDSARDLIERYGTPTRPIPGQLITPQRRPQPVTALNTPNPFHPQSRMLFFTPHRPLCSLTVPRLGQSFLHHHHLTLPYNCASSGMTKSQMHYSELKTTHSVLLIRASH